MLTLINLRSYIFNPSFLPGSLLTTASKFDPNSIMRYYYFFLSILLERKLAYKSTSLLTAKRISSLGVHSEVSSGRKPRSVESHNSARIGGITLVVENKIFVPETGIIGVITKSKYAIFLYRGGHVSRCARMAAGRQIVEHLKSRDKINRPFAKVDFHSCAN